MNDMSFPTLSKIVFVIVALVLGEPLSHSLVAKPQRQPLTTEQVLRRIRRAHILSKIPKNAFDSILFSGCMRIDQGMVPKTTPKSDLNCIREETGILQPSHTYVSVAVGKNRVTELVDIEQGKGWQIVDPATFSTNSSRTTSALHKLKYDALVENAKHSLPALLALLQSSDQLNHTQLEVISGANEIVLKWRTEQSLNEFYFNPTTFLCEKQVRTVGTDKSILKYSGYKPVANVMLPHTIGVAKADGTTMATREIQRWELAVQWPSDHFQPQTIRVFSISQLTRSSDH
jgi:hypothetical protein